MKKRIAALVILMVFMGVAIAEGFTPSMFLGSRGLMVLDENQMNGTGSGEESEPNEELEMVKQYRMVGFTMSEQENSAPAIYFTDNGVLYAAFEMMAMFGHGTMDGKGLSQVFIDFCNAYDFDLYTFGLNGGTQFAYADDPEAMAEVFNASGADIENAGFTETKEEFIEAVKAAFE